MTILKNILISWNLAISSREFVSLESFFFFGNVRRVLKPLRLYSSTSSVSIDSFLHIILEKELRSPFLLHSVFQTKF